MKTRAILNSSTNFSSSWTHQELKRSFEELGIRSDMNLIVHSSLSSIGHVIGGAEALIYALLNTVKDGTLVMPSFSAQISSPCTWQEPPVPQHLLKKFKHGLIGYNPLRTPTWGIGIVAELFRCWPGVVRSNHPIDSFCAYGKNSQLILEKKDLSFSMGENSPLAKLYDLDGYILLLGVDYSVNSSLHLAEARSNFCSVVQISAPICDQNDCSHWTTFNDYDYSTDHFSRIGYLYEAESSLLDFIKGPVGISSSRLIRMKPFVDWATSYFNKLKLK